MVVMLWGKMKQDEEDSMLQKGRNVSFAHFRQVFLFVIILFLGDL